MLFGVNLENTNYLGKQYNSLSFSNRNYFGSNKLKVFFEEQFEYNSALGNKSSFLLNLGAELNVKDGLWIDFNSGYLKNNNVNSSKFSTQLRFRYALPE